MRDDATPDEVAARLNSAAIHLLRLLREEDRRSGLSPARLSALSVLVYGGEVTVGRLAEIEHVRSPTMSGVIDGLEAERLVRRKPAPGDRRSTVVEATAKGRRLMERARGRRIEALSKRLQPLDASERAVLGEAARLMEALTQEPRLRVRHPGPAGSRN